MHLHSYVVFFALIVSLFFSACGKQINQPNINQLENKFTSQTNKKWNKHLEENINSPFDEDQDIGQGYNKMGARFVQPCTTSVEVETPTSANSAVVTYDDDLSEETLRNQLELDLSITIPIQGINISPKLAFARDAAKTKLSHTTSLIVNVVLGDRKLKNTFIPVISPQYEKDFDASGKLIDPYDFMKKCGDQIVTSQKLSSKVIVTAKVNFDSTSDLFSFEAALGLSPTIAPGWNLNFRIKDVNLEIRKRATMRLYGIQIGGSAERLVRILDAGCTLDQFDKCQDLLNKAKFYVTDDYINQLDPLNISVWNIEKVGTKEYGLMSVKNAAGTILNLDLTKDNESEQKLILLGVLSANRRNFRGLHFV